MGYKQLAKVICVACSEPLGEHSKRDLVRCLFRVQGTMVSDGIENTSDGISAQEGISAQDGYSDEDLADGRNEGHIRGFDSHIG